MPQTVSNPMGRGRQRHEYSKLNDASTPASVNGASPVAVSERKANPPDVMVNGFKPCRTVADAWSAKGKRAGPQKHRRKAGDSSKCVITSSAACTVNGCNGRDHSLKEDSRPGKVGLPKDLDLEEPPKNGCEPSPQKKKRSRRRKSKKKRNQVLDQKYLTPKEEEDWEREEEDWEKEEEDWELETEGAKPVQWGDISYGTQPYGPEDKLGFVQKCLEPQLDPPPPPEIGVYRPAKCHPHPIEWLCYYVPTEPGQFSDAEE